MNATYQLWNMGNRRNVDLIRGVICKLLFFYQKKKDWIKLYILYVLFSTTKIINSNLLKTSFTYSKTVLFVVRLNFIFFFVWKVCCIQRLFMTKPVHTYIFMLWTKSYILYIIINSYLRAPSLSYQCWN